MQDSAGAATRHTVMQEPAAAMLVLPVEVWACTAGRAQAGKRGRCKQRAGQEVPGRRAPFLRAVAAAPRAAGEDAVRHVIMGPAAAVVHALPSLAPFAALAKRGAPRLRQHRLRRPAVHFGLFWSTPTPSYALEMRRLDCRIQ